jgi:hypothetical protein
VNHVSVESTSRIACDSMSDRNFIPPSNSSFAPQISPITGLESGFWIAYLCFNSGLATNN